MQPLTEAGDMRARWRDGRAMSQMAAGFIKPNDRLSSFERLEIYNRQYWYRVKDCFFDDYPGLRFILGEPRFEGLAVAYLAQCPSESFTLRNLGGRLLEFLEANPRWIRPWGKAPLEMARLEWAHIEAFDNEAKPRLQTESLGGTRPENLRLELQPHLTLLELGYELDKLLIKLKHDEGLRHEASNAMGGKRGAKPGGRKRPLRPKTVFLAVHRLDDSVYYKRLQPRQFQLLSSLRAGATLGEACQVVAQPTQADAAQIAEWFKTWAALGWFCKPE